MQLLLLEGSRSSVGVSCPLPLLDLLHRTQEEILATGLGQKHGIESVSYFIAVIKPQGTCFAFSSQPTS